MRKKKKKKKKKKNKLLTKHALYGIIDLVLYLHRLLILRFTTKHENELLLTQEVSTERWEQRTPEERKTAHAQREKASTQ